MHSYDTPEDKLRVEALLSLQILDTPAEFEFDELVRLASEICGTPISLVSLVDRDRQWFKASVGLATRETHRNLSFCTHAIQRPELFVIENATEDHRFVNNQLVTGDPGIRFYAGMPLQTPSGHAIGTLCVIDTKPRTLTEKQRESLAILARQVSIRLELRIKQRALEQALAMNEKLVAHLNQQNTQFLSFMNNGPFVSYIKDSSGRYVFCNDRLRQKFGLKDNSWAGLTDNEIFAPPIADEFRAHDLAVLERGTAVEMPEVSVALDGTTTHWRSFKFPLRQPDGQVMLAGMSIDLTEQLAKEAELKRILQEKLDLARDLEATTTLMRSFINHNPNVCFFKSEEGQYLSYNSRFAELFGIGPTDWIGKTDHDVLEAEQADSIRARDIEILGQNEVVETVRHITNSQGDQVWHKSLNFAIRTPDGRNTLACVSIDITREIEREQSLSQANSSLQLLATTDALTGLANRRTFETHVATEFARAGRNHTPLSLIVLDIDNFKKRNDTLGHTAGDEALRIIGRVLRESLRATDLSARVGGEEFAILLPGTDLSHAILLARRIQTRLRQAKAGTMPLSASIGIVTDDGSATTWEGMVSQADQAMYMAKRSGKDRYVIFDGLGTVSDLSLPCTGDASLARTSVA